MICPLPDGELLEDNSCSEVTVVDMYKEMYVCRKRKKKTGKGGEMRRREGEREENEGGDNKGNN